MMGRFRHELLLVRVCTVAALWALLILASPVLGQPPEDLGSPRDLTGQLVVDVRVEGNEVVTDHQITSLIRTRAGREFRIDTVEDDVRKLNRTRKFLDVKTRYELPPSGGVIVVYQVVERPMVRELQFLGNRIYRDKKLAEEAGIKVGDPLDPYTIDDARQRIEELYKTKGINNTTVTVLEGNKPGDGSAIFLVNEGVKQKIKSVKFVGNTIATGARLKTQIQSKPTILWFFRGQVDRQLIDGDIDRLTAYYRSLGFFRARVGRVLDWDEEQRWLTLTFVIDEGPRYVVRNVSIVGNLKYPADQLTPEVTIAEGEFYDQGKMSIDVATLKDFYGRKGYIFADVQADQRFLEQPGQLDLVYQIEEGDRYRVGRIDVQITGENPHTRIRTVLNRMSIRPGDVCDTRELRNSERRLKASQLFNVDPSRGVSPKIVIAPPGEEVAPPKYARGSSAPPPGGSGFRGQSPDPDRYIVLTVEGQLRPESELPPADAADAAPPDMQAPGGSPPGVRPPPSNRQVVPLPPTRPVVRGQSPDNSYHSSRGYGHATTPHSRQIPRWQPDRPGSIPQVLRGVPQPPPARQPATTTVRSQPQSTWAGYAHQRNVVRAQSPWPGYQQPPPANPWTGYPGYQNNVPPRNALPPTNVLPPPPQAQLLPPGQVPPGGQLTPLPPGQQFPQQQIPRQQLPPAYVPQQGPPVYELAPGQLPSSDNMGELMPDGGGSVFLNDEPPDPFVTIVPQVEEARTGRLMFGVGVNSDAGVIGSAVLEEQNFDIARPPSSFRDFIDGTAFRGAGQRFRLEAVPGSQLQRYMFNFTEPYLFDTQYSFGVSGFLFDRRYDDWDESRAGGQLTLGRQLAPDLSATIAIRAEDVKLDQPRIPTPPEVLAAIGHTDVYKVRAALTHDTRDSAFLPTEGHLVELSYEQTFGEFQYPRGMVDIRQYLLVRQRPDGSGRHVVAINGQVGLTGNNTPVFDNFFAGGTTTIRGFDFRGASPVVMGTTVGGEFMLLGSVEYLMPITADDALRAVFFVDTGTVEERVKLSADNFRVAPGVGLRITIPAMGPAPIALDLAFPVAHADTDELRNFSFRVGLFR